MNQSKKKRRIHTDGETYGFDQSRRPKLHRSYRGIMDALRKVWSITHVPDGDAVWAMGRPEKAALPLEGLRVSVWNLCKGAGDILFEHDFRSLLYRSDLVLAQEALLSEKAMRAFLEPGFRGFHGASYVRSDGIRDGVLTMSRGVELTPLQRFFLKSQEPIFKTPKVGMFGCFPLEQNNTTLLVVNLHSTLVRSSRQAQCDMEELVGLLPEHDGPMIVAGDFNTISPAYLRKIVGVLQSIGLELVELDHDPRSRITALDQIFVRQISVQSSFVDTTICSSDHFPIHMICSIDLGK